MRRVRHRFEPPPFEAVVLCGGASRRMGVDKATVDLGRGPLAPYVAQVLAEAGAVRVRALGGDPARLGPLGLEVVADERPGAGPLAAVATALRTATVGVVFVAACDLPGIHVEGVRRVLAALDETHDASVPRLGGRPQPLHAAYQRRAAAMLDAAVAEGEARLVSAVARLATVTPTGVDPAWLADVDTPHDLARWAGPERDPGTLDGWPRLPIEDGEDADT